MATQVEIAKKLGLDVSSVNKILNQCKGPVFKKETIDRVFATARDMGYDFTKIKFRHRRRHKRNDVKIGVEVSIINQDGSLHDQGLATIQDISTGGARLTDVSLPMGTLPIGPFTIQIKPLRTQMQTMEIPGKVVRLIQDDDLAFGVSFGELDGRSRKRLEKVLSN